MLEHIVDPSYRRRVGKAFVIDTRVRFHSTGDVELDGYGGIILGCSVTDHPSAYIVLLDRPLRRGDRAVQMTECCLEHDEIHLRATRLDDGVAVAP